MRTSDSANELAGSGAAGDILYHAAAVHALASTIVRDDGNLPPADRDQQAERYALRAVELLRSAHAAKYFADAEHVNSLKSDPDLGPLRQRADFKKLLTDVQPSGSK